MFGNFAKYSAKNECLFYHRNSEILPKHFRPNIRPIFVPKSISVNHCIQGIFAGQMAKMARVRSSLVAVRTCVAFILVAGIVAIHRIAGVSTAAREIELPTS